MAPKQDVYDIVRDRILTQLDAGTVPWMQPWSVRRPQNAVSKHQYQGINLFLLPRDYPDHRWLTFKQAQELGGSVRKGEKSSIVVFWKMLDVDDEKSVTGKKKIPLLRYFSVFNVAQCDGLKLAPLADREHTANTSAEQIVKGMQNAPKITSYGDRAFYSPGNDTITVPPAETFSNGDAYYATLFHEMTHSTGHVSRLDRHAEMTLKSFGCEDYGKEELVAEFGAAYLCAVAGIDNDKVLTNSAAYIASWRRAIKEADKKLLVSAASKAQKSTVYIVGEED